MRTRWKIYCSQIHSSVFFFLLLLCFGPISYDGFVSAFSQECPFLQAFASRDSITPGRSLTINVNVKGAKVINAVIKVEMPSNVIFEQSVTYPKQKSIDIVQENPNVYFLNAAIPGNGKCRTFSIKVRMLPLYQSFVEGSII